MSNYFYGNEISSYGIEHGYVDYRTFAKAFQHVLCNSIMCLVYEKDLTLEQISGSVFEDDSCSIKEVFQYYLVSDNARILLEEADELLWYCEELDIFIWGVTHYGTSWDYVLTNIKIGD